jgi:hypothetical protein
MEQGCMHAHQWQGRRAGERVLLLNIRVEVAERRWAVVDAQAEGDIGSHRSVHQADVLRHRRHGVLQRCVRQLQRL